MIYYYTTIFVFFLLCLAYAAYVLFTRYTTLRSLRQLGFRVRMLAKGQAANLGMLLNAHPLVLFFCDRLSIELERELERMERRQHLHTPYHRRRPVFFPSERLRLLTHRVERLEQSI